MPRAVIPSYARPAARAVLASLSPDLLKLKKYRDLHAAGGCDPTTGFCTVASQALYFLLGGKKAGYAMKVMQHEGGSHWFLTGPDGEVIDVTATQFRTRPDYAQGRGAWPAVPKPGNAPMLATLKLLDRARARLRATTAKPAGYRLRPVPWPW